MNERKFHQVGIPQFGRGSQTNIYDVLLCVVEFIGCERASVRPSKMRFRPSGKIRESRTRRNQDVLAIPNPSEKFGYPCDILRSNEFPETVPYHATLKRDDVDPT